MHENQRICHVNGNRIAAQSLGIQHNDLLGLVLDGLAEREWADHLHAPAKAKHFPGGLYAVTKGDFDLDLYLPIAE